MAKNTELVTIDQKQFIAMVGELPFSTKQINLLMQKTPAKFIKNRPIPGGGTADFVETSYVVGMLNLITGYRWDFEVIEEKEAHGQIIIRGRLTIETKQGGKISKSQYGRASIKFKTTLVGAKRVATDETVDFGNDHKAAVSDAIKKCASLFGIAWDVFGKEDSKEMQVVDTSPVEPEVMADPIEIVSARVTGKLNGMSSMDRIRAIKATGVIDIKKFSEANWRRLDMDLGTDKGKVATEELPDEPRA